MEINLKLLAMKISRHDSNICYFDGVQLRYNKSERLYGIKHHNHANIIEWINEVRFLWDLDYQDLNQVCVIFDPADYDLPNSCFNENLYNEYLHLPLSCKVFHLDHHFAHALSTWVMTDEIPTVHFVIDGLGDESSWSVFNRNGLVDRDVFSGFNSLGKNMYHTALMLDIQGSELDIANKLMGLQSYGVIDGTFLAYLENTFTNDMNDLDKIFDYQQWEYFKGDSHVAALTKLNWAKTIHKFMEKVLINFFSKFANKNDIITYSGGVAQNVVWNTALKSYFPNLIIPPHSADDGLSLGGIEWLRMHNNLPRFDINDFPYIQSDEHPLAEPTQETLTFVAEQLSLGKIVAWYQGNGEIGPRALGNRSILLDPRIMQGKEIINSVKKRENYRPFGASVLKEYQDTYFDLGWDDQYMLYTAKVKTNTIPCITHIDGTCRIQTVTEKNAVFKKLLSLYYERTGCPVLLNTSFNLAGKPICSSIQEAKTIFNITNIDVLVVGNSIYTKPCIK